VRTTQTTVVRWWDETSTAHLDHVLSPGIMDGIKG
jgi:hypothetical protein